MDDTKQTGPDFICLTPQEKTLLLKIARQALEDSVHGRFLEDLPWDEIPPRLREPGATFVTLMMGDELRGCVGSLEPKLPLVEDVRRHAVAAALEDYRFHPVLAFELDDIVIEISRLTPLRRLEYHSPEDLIPKLCSGQDGILIIDGPSRATFLPQVWKKIPEPENFLSLLCLKMGAQPDHWKKKKIEVWTYRVEKFHE